MENDPFSPWVMLSNLNITFFNLTLSGFGYLVALMVLFFSIALFSGIEVAFFSLNHDVTHKIKLKNSKLNSKVVHLLERPKYLFFTIFTLVSLCLVGFIAVGYAWFKCYSGIYNASFSGNLLFAIFNLFLIVFLGLLGPRIYASRNPNFFLNFGTYPLYFLNKLFFPITHVFVTISNSINQKFNKSQNTSVEELSTVLDLSNKPSTEEQEMLKGIIEFGSIEVSEIMCPRVDVQAFEISETYSEILEKIVESGYSRIPVYQESFDNIKGILYIKDLLPFFNSKADFKWQTLLRPPYYVPEQKKIDELLQELQRNKIQMAIVIDEYGGTSGIVTMEDILEEIIGEIADEFDGEEINFTKINDTTYLFDGKIAIDDACKELGVSHSFFDNVRGDADTLAGLMLEIKGEFPLLNDTIQFEKFTFTIVEFEKRRIKKIKVSISD